MTWKDRIDQIKVTFGIKNNRLLEQSLGLSNGYINDLIGGIKNKNPSKIINALTEKYKISPIWFFDESTGMFGDKQENAVRQESELILAIRKVENNNEGRFSDIETRLSALETLIKQEKAASEAAVGRPVQPAETGPVYPENVMTGDFTGEPEPEYVVEERIKIPYVRNIAAGLPIPQAEDTGEYVLVPARLIKQGHRYYAASIRGGSMTEAGIRNGDLVLIRCSDTPQDGAIQVVRYRERSTLKRLREVGGKGWEIHYEDGTGRVIFSDSADYEIQGDFVAVLPAATVLQG